MSKIPESASPDKGAQSPSIREQIKQLIETNPDMTQQAIANQSGVGKSALSLWINDNYSGDNNKLEKKLSQWLVKTAEAEEVQTTTFVPEDPGYYDTPTSKNLIWPVLLYSHLRGSMGLVYGGAGLCKSSTIHEYQRKMPNVWIVTCSPATARLSPCLSHTADEMDISVASSKASVIEQAIVDRVKGSKGLLIFDEAQYLTVETLYELTMIRERGGVPIVLLGNEQIYGTMKKGFAQLYSRIGKRKRLKGASIGDLEACLSAWEKCQKLKHGTLLSTDIQKFFWGHGTSKLGPVRQDGGLRNVNECLALAFFLASGKSEPVELKHIKAAWTDLAA
jgi:DNA transposition AAA+ family ATPase